MSTKRHRFTPEDKVKIIREHLEEGKRVSELFERYQMHPNAFYQWKKEFFEGAVNIFTPKNKSNRNKEQEKIKFLEEKLQQKESVISEIVSDYINYKKKLNGEYYNSLWDGSAAVSYTHLTLPTKRIV